MIRLFYTLFIAASVLVLSFWVESDSIERTKKPVSHKINSNSPPSIQMFDAIVKYSKAYGVPEKYAFGVAYAENRYTGPMQWDYVWKKSSAGALGPMQIMPKSAKIVWPNRKFTLEQLTNDIDFNVETSMKILRRFYDVHKDWKLALGAYNTGSPVINSYVRDVVSRY